MVFSKKIAVDPVKDGPGKTMPCGCGNGRITLPSTGPDTPAKQVTCPACDGTMMVKDRDA